MKAIAHKLPWMLAWFFACACLLAAYHANQPDKALLQEGLGLSSPNAEILTIDEFPSTPAENIQVGNNRVVDAGRLTENKAKKAGKYFFSNATTCLTNTCHQVVFTFFLAAPLVYKYLYLLYCVFLI